MIYNVSIARPEDDYKTLDSSRMDIIKLSDSVISSVSNGNDYVIKHSFQVNKISETEEEVNLVSTCADVNFTYITRMDMQRFVDEVFQAIQRRKLPDSIDYMKELKDLAMSALGEILLDDHGIMSINSTYNAFGFIFAGTDKVGTFEQIRFNNADVIELIDLFSIVEAQFIENINIEFALKGVKHILTLEHIRDSRFTIKKLAKSDTNDIPEVTPKSSFYDHEDFISDRRKLVNVGASNDNLSIDEFDDIF